MMEPADNDCKTAAGRYILQNNKERNERKNEWNHIMDI